jgi:PAS domain S-box-containing protein
LIGEEYKRLLEDIKDAYFLVQGYEVILVSDKLAELYGYTKDEFAGKFVMSAPTIFNERERLLRLYKRKPSKQGAPERYETTTIAKDGTRIPIEVSVWPTHYRGRPAIAGIVVDMRERKKRQAEAIRIHEDERRRLARELHDETIQELVLLCHRLKDITSGTYGQLPLSAQERLEEIERLAEKTIGGLRSVIQDLRPTTLDDMGLASSLRWLVGRLATEGGVQAEVYVPGEEKRLSPETELALFRIAQEALSNVLKHAHALSVSVTLKFGKDRVTMSISDNGQGFKMPVTLSHFVRKDKFGLVGINERVVFLGGTLKIDSSPGNGTLVKVVLPEKIKSRQVRTKPAYSS